ncbi:MAG: Vitamin B12 dependent methionine synthase activation subunit [Ruminococcaceae bacterium]|nr:Vitamin B12 dependent methionine synthase activation subunit [Oscillospiraceae bacterium]
MMDVVLVRSYAPPPVDRREIIRYMSARELTEELTALLEECLREAEGHLRYAVCWREVPVSVTDTGVDLGFAAVESASLRKQLTGCGRAVLFGATVGLELDRLIARYSRLQPVKALILQAIGAERVEALCDAFCADIRRQAQEKGEFTRSRFSPGYGDVPLALQQDIFRVLDCARMIGLTLNGSLLMTPTKSVTAIIGIGDGSQQPDKEKCSACTKGDCVFRNL